MKPDSVTVPFDDVAALKQKAKIHMALERTAAALQGPAKPTNSQFLKWMIILTCTGSVLAIGLWGLLSIQGDFILFQQDATLFRKGARIDNLPADDPVCVGRRVYIYDLPPQFNENVLQKLCAQGSYYDDYCCNGGLGKRMEHVMEPMEAWYRTEQYLVEPIIHERFKQYRCLTGNPDLADLLYLPYYVGVDYSVTTDTNMMQVRDFLVERFVGWLMAHPAWARSQGHKHFLVLGRIVWDFSRRVEMSGWGNSLLASTELQNVTKILLERNPHSGDPKQLAIPFPTNFHPASDAEIDLWRKTVLESKREKLVSFVGAPRNLTFKPSMKIRDFLFEQCDSSELCETLHCDKMNCRMNPQVVTKLFLKTHFCCQPPGDSSTRKGTFDCLIAGGIPVFFSPNSAYTQYLWHLPANGSSYSVLIEEKDVMDSKVNVIDVLSKIPPSRIEEMHAFIGREIMPRIVFDMPGAGRSRDSKMKDAFDNILENFFDPTFETYPASLGVSEAPAKA